MHNLLPEDRTLVEYTSRYTRNRSIGISIFAWLIIILDFIASVTGIWRGLLYLFPSKQVGWSICAASAGVIVACICYIIAKHNMLRLSAQHARRHAEFRYEKRGEIRDFANLFNSISFRICFCYMLGSDTVAVVTIAQYFGITPPDFLHWCALWAIALLFSLILLYMVFMGDFIGQYFIRSADFAEGEEAKYKKQEGKAEPFNNKRSL